MTMPSGAHLWKKAKKLIPGGNQLLSKRPEMFLPEGWPSYYKKASGVEIWDLDDQRYIDMSMMGIGSCVLGYANPDVNDAAKRAIDAGNMCTLNCPEEVELAEKLVSLHPWAQMVRFAKTGGEACAIAVRIARAASGRDKIAFCGYHGWSDWYLSANLGNPKHLDGQLLPGLKPAGVPKSLKNTAFPFHYGKIEGLERIVAENKTEIGLIIMEVARNKGIDIDFLKAVRRIAQDIGAVLIFDEITSGFRLRVGGTHILYDLKPDIVILGKAMGNGFPIAAVVGRTEVMEFAQDTFISSTYWTERIGFAAALEVIRQFETNDVARQLIETGNYLRKGLQNIFASEGLKISVDGLASVPTFTIQEEKPLMVKTIFTQEMLKKGFLASTLVYISLAHTKQIVDQYLTEAEEVFQTIARAVREGSLDDLLEGPVCHAGFARLA